MSKEQTRMLQLKKKIEERKRELVVLKNSLTFVNRELNDLQDEVSILELGGTIKGVQEWRDKKRLQQDKMKIDKVIKELSKYETDLADEFSDWLKRKQEGFDSALADMLMELLTKAESGDFK